MRIIDADEAIRLSKDDKLAWVYDLTDLEEFLVGVPTLEAEPVKHTRWEWFEEWLPSTPEHPRECEDCGWRCGACKAALEDVVGGYWDNPEEKPELAYCPKCGAKMGQEVEE